MAASHKRRAARIKPFEELPPGREPGRASGPVVNPRDYPKLYKMYQEGYLMSEIGREFGVSGATAGRLIRKYQAEAGV
jgi:DNA invertase Pin-like site-specific DNA recombinase